MYPLPGLPVLRTKTVLCSRFAFFAFQAMDARNRSREDQEHRLGFEYASKRSFRFDFGAASVKLHNESKTSVTVGTFACAVRPSVKPISLYFTSFRLVKRLLAGELSFWALNVSVVFAKIGLQ